MIEDRRHDALRRELGELRREVRDRFDEGEARFDKQDVLLKKMEAFITLHALGRIGSAAVMWLLRAGSYAALIVGAYFTMRGKP